MLLVSPRSICFAVAVMLSNVPCNLLSPDLTEKQRKDTARRILLGSIFVLVWGSRSTIWQHFATSIRYIRQAEKFFGGKVHKKRVGGGGIELQ